MWWIEFKNNSEAHTRYMIAEYVYCSTSTNNGGWLLIQLINWKLVKRNKPSRVAWLEGYVKKILSMNFGCHLQEEFNFITKKAFIYMKIGIFKKSADCQATKFQ